MFLLYYYNNKYLSIFYFFHIFIVKRVKKMKFLVKEEQFKRVISKVQDLMENYLLSEGINEDKALSILQKNKIENSEEIVKFLKNKDKSKNHKTLPAMAAFYANAKNNEEFSTVLKTFEKLFRESSPPDITVTSENQVNVLNKTFDFNDFDGFKEFIDHYYFKESDEDKLEEEKLYSVSGNKIFENDKFIIYEAPSARVCIKLFGANYEEREYVKRGYCIGYGTVDAPGTWYPNYRKPDGSWRLTLYVAVDKEKLSNYAQTGEDHSSLLNVIGVREEHGDKEFFVWDRKNDGSGKSVEGYNSVKDYMKMLEDNGVNLSLFKTKPFIDLTDDSIDSLANDQTNDRLFKSLSAKQKYKYIGTKAKILTPYQMKFVLTYMPSAVILNFVKNFEKVGNLPIESFDMLTTNLQKSYINSKIIQLTNNLPDFNEKLFFNYLKNSDLESYAINLIKNSFVSEKYENKNKEESLKVLSLLSPEEFFNSLKNETKITINANNFVKYELPKNLGDYIQNAKELSLDGLEIESIPESIGKAKNLTTLTIYNCHSLSTIPSTIGELTNLDDFNITNCSRLKELPDSIGQLVNLSHLNLSDNSLERIPNTISNLKNLFILNLDGNPIEPIPAEVLNSCENLGIVTATIEGETSQLHHDENGWEWKF